MSQLRALLPLPVVKPTDGVVSPDSSGSGRYVWAILWPSWIDVLTGGGDQCM